MNEPLTKRQIYVAGICVSQATDDFTKPLSQWEINFLIDCQECANQRTDNQLHSEYCALVRKLHSTDLNCP